MQPSVPLVSSSKRATVATLIPPPITTSSSTLSASSSSSSPSIRSLAIDDGHDDDPTMRLVPTSRVRRSPLWALLALSRPDILRNIVAVVLLFVDCLCSVGIPFVLEAIIDEATSERDDTSSGAKHDAFSVISLSLLNLLLLALTQAVCYFGCTYIFRTSGARIVKRVREMLFANLLVRDDDFHASCTPDELVNNLKDVAFLEPMLADVVQLGRNFLFIIGGIVALFYGRPRQLGIAVMVGALVTLLISQPHSRWFRLLARASAANDDGFMTTAKLALANHSERQRVNHWRWRLAADVAACLATDVRKAKTAAGWEALLGLLANAGLGLSVWQASILVINNKITPQAIVSFFLIVDMVYTNLKEFFDCTEDYLNWRVQTEQLFTQLYGHTSNNSSNNNASGVTIITEHKSSAL